MNKKNYFICSLILVIAYSVAIVSIASVRMEFFPGFLVVPAGVLVSVISAPFIVSVVLITKEIKTVFPSVLCGLGAAFAQTEAYSSLLLLAATQVFILLLMGTMVACLWNFYKNHDGKMQRRRVFFVLQILLVVTSPLIGYKVGVWMGKMSGESASKYLTDDQLLRNLTDNDMQRRWDTGWYLARENPELLMRGVLHQNSNISRRSIEAVRLFKVYSVIEKLEVIAESDIDEARRKQASHLRSLIGNIP